MIRTFIIYSVFLLSCQFTLSQHYDIGYNTEYNTIREINLDSTNYKTIEFSIDNNKKIKKLFTHDQNIIEELVFIDDVLVSGIEYFINPQFPFLKTPRSFQIQEVEREIANYQNIKFTASLIKYLPKMKKGIFKLRVYTDTDSTNFYILETNQGEKIYFQQ